MTRALQTVCSIFALSCGQLYRI